MIEMSDDNFEELVSAAMDSISDHYRKHMNNVGFVIEKDPSQEQRQKLHLWQGQTLYGLYEGIPLTRRGSGYNLVLPDKITIFKNPILASSNSVTEASNQVRKTVWHEVAHHFGLDHEQIYRLGGS